MTADREEQVYDCEVVVDRARGMKAPALKDAARATFDVAGETYPQYPDIAAFSAMVVGGAMEMTFELRQGSANMSGAAVRALTVGAMVVERAGYGAEIEVLRLKVEVA